MKASAQAHSTKAPTGIAAAEWQARLDLAASYRLAAQFGWHDLFGNHFSVRVPPRSIISFWRLISNSDRLLRGSVRSCPVSEGWPG